MGGREGNLSGVTWPGPDIMKQMGQNWHLNCIVLGLGVSGPTRLWGFR
jgi:hypothetical protein